jgi:hypothetical protein
LTVETERPVALSASPDRNPSATRRTSATHRGGWYDPDSATWEDEAATVFEAFRADTAAHSHHPREDDGFGRTGY